MTTNASSSVRIFRAIASIGWELRKRGKGAISTPNSALKMALYAAGRSADRIAACTRRGGITIANVVGKVEASTTGGSISARFSSPLSEEV
jgi:hypothetical protein